MGASDSEAALPFSSEAAASGWDEATEALVDSDEPGWRAETDTPATPGGFERPRIRSAAVSPCSMKQQQQQQQQHRTPRSSLARRLKPAGLGASASNAGGSAQQLQQQQTAASVGAGFRGRSSGDAAATAAETWGRRFATFRVRCRWTLILVLLFFLILAAGHSYCMLLVLSLIVAIYKEIIQAKERREAERLPDFHLLKWYWFSVTIVGIGLPWSLQRLRGIDPKTIDWILGFHSLGFYVAWFLGFIWFILSLRKSFLRYQFSQLGVMLVVLLFVVSQSLIQVANIYSGLIWFFLPTSLVIVNDIFAYLCGTAFGRTRLIRLSPKKTVEGYLGAAVVTLLWAWFVGRQLERHAMFVCPQPYISFEPFAVFRDLSCTPSPVFVPRCIDSSFERWGVSWWQVDPLQQLQQQQQQQQLLQLLREHQNLMTQAAAADEQLLLLRTQSNQQRNRQQQQHRDQAEQQTTRPSKRQEDTDDVPEQQQQVEALQQQIWKRLEAMGSEREIRQIEMRNNCNSFFASPFDFHAMVLGSFAAFFAPFGGFFASGFKRAVRIKDFGYFIPGHGGVTDRFDCQVVMGLFTFLYQKTFVPQIGEAEAAARRSVEQQQHQQLLLQQEEQLQGRNRGSSSGTAFTANYATNAQQAELVTQGVEDTAIEALLQAARGLNSRQLAALQKRLEVITAAKAAAGD